MHCFKNHVVSIWTQSVGQADIPGGTGKEAATHAPSDSSVEQIYCEKLKVMLTSVFICLADQGIGFLARR